MEWRILGKYEKVIIPSMKKVRKLTLLIYLPTKERWLVKIHFHPQTLMHTQTSQPVTNVEFENQHGKKDKKHVLFYSGLQKTVVNPVLPCEIARLLHKTEKDKLTILSLGHFKIFCKVATQTIKPQASQGVVMTSIELFF